MRKLSIFISHPSEFLTNCQPHGDGLAAFEFIYRLASRGHTLHVAVSSMDIQGDLPSNIKLYPVKLWTKFSTLNSIEYMIRVRQIFNHLHCQYGVDIIHQLNPVEAGLSYSLFGSNVPVILGLFVPGWPANSQPSTLKTSSLGAVSSFFSRPFVRWCDIQQQKHAAALLLSTPAAVSQLYQQERNKDKIFYLPYGIDIKTFSPSDNFKCSTTEQSILYLARLNHQKGIYTLLEAFEKVTNTFPSCKLTIAGAGKELELVQQKISGISCAANITLLGGIPRQQVPDLMRQCTVYCLPSYGEPFGISVLEAMSCGKPVVGTEAGGLAHLISNEGGKKVSPQNAKELAQSLIEILSSPEKQMSMAKYNRAIVEQHYSWEKVIDKLEAIYSKF